MSIKITNKLTEAEKVQVTELQRICNKFDNLKNEAYLSTEINFDPSLPSFFMSFEGNKIIAFLTLFMPERTAAEITAFVHPDYRGKKIFSELLSSAVTSLKQMGIPKLQFCIEHGSLNGLNVAHHLGKIIFDRSEYTLIINEFKPVYSVNPLKLVGINKENASLFKPYLGECFDDEELNILDVALASYDRFPFAVTENDIPVGFFFLLAEPHKTIIHGVAVRKNQRGKGFGKMLMDYAVTESLKLRPEAELDVDSNNPVAYHIYKNCGFTEKLRIDYYDFIL